VRAAVLATLLGLAPLLACGRPAEEERERITSGGSAPAVVGVATVAATEETIEEEVEGFGTVAAEAEPPEVRDARMQLAEAEAQQRLAHEQVTRLEALARGAVAPRKELEAARAAAAAADAAAARARQVLAAFGPRMASSPLGPDEAWLLVQVVQRDVPRVAPGAAVRFLPDALPARALTGRVDAAAAYVEATSRTAPVRVRVEDPEHLLRPGMTGAVRIAAGAPHRAVVVPSDAVVYDGAAPVVFVPAAAGGYEARAVGLGVVRDGRVEITHGLSAGTPVVTTGAASLLSAARLPAADVD
jgi:cobalt-zinc-cadmium efflux system membrane fusion protein